jgi:hypothetical protein
MAVKGQGFTMRDYIERRFQRGWIQRRPTSPPGRPADAINLALWLEVPVEYLFAAAPAYERMEVWEVAARASLEVFFSESNEGRDARRYRIDFENHISLHREEAPMTAARWAGWFDGYQRGRARERTESESLEGAPQEQSGAAPDADQPKS